MNKEFDEDKCKDYLKFLLSFAPTIPPIPGMCPTFYHTLRYEEDVKLWNKLTEIKEYVSWSKNE